MPVKELEMKPQRFDSSEVAPGTLKAMLGLEKYTHSSECSIELPLLELVKTRASQINGCGFCLDMHTKDARAAGETEQRLYTLSVWYETPFFTPRERAALAWTEAVTLIAEDGVPDELYEAARKQFSEKELADLTLAIVAINGWNRFAIAFRKEPGTYQVGSH